MKPAAFDYARPGSLEEALALLARHGEAARILAGGQSLLPALNFRLSAPDLLIDIARLEALKGVRREGEDIVIGALTRHVEVERSGVIAADLPLLAAAVRHVGHAAIRNRGTFGGSLANADPAAELPACTLALAGRITVAGPGGQRTLAADAFFRGLYETAIEPGEILVSVAFRPMGSEERWAFLELSRRSGDFAMAGIALHARLDGDALASVRPVFFGVGATPVLAGHAADALAGRTVSSGATARACAALADDLDPQDDLQASAAMRLHLARVLLQRAMRRISGES